MSQRPSALTTQSHQPATTGVSGRQAETVQIDKAFDFLGARRLLEIQRFPKTPPRKKNKIPQTCYN
jgi:hypothetical protein